MIENKFIHEPFTGICGNVYWPFWSAAIGRSNHLASLWRGTLHTFINIIALPCLRSNAWVSVCNFLLPNTCSCSLLIPYKFVWVDLDIFDTVPIWMVNWVLSGIASRVFLLTSPFFSVEFIPKSRVDRDLEGGSMVTLYWYWRGIYTKWLWYQVARKYQVSVPGFHVDVGKYLGNLFLWY